MRPRYRLMLLLVSLSMMVGCTLFQQSAPHAFFSPDPQNRTLYETLGHDADELVAGCAATHSCDRAHFIRGLLALYEDRDGAAHHFQAAVAAASNRNRASSSQFWLKLLDDTPAGGIQNGHFSQATLQLVRELIDREMQAMKELETAQSLQRELKARDKKLEDLTNQLEALKQVDREMREIAPPSRPPSKTNPPLKKESP